MENNTFYILQWVFGIISMFFFGMAPLIVWYRIEHKLLNKAVKKIFDEGEMTIKYYVRGLTKDTERFDYLFSILTDFGFHIISKTNDGVMFGFLTKDETDE